MNHCHFCGNNIPDEVDTCAQANYACDGPKTRESNTPDTEWEKKFDEEFVVHMNGEKYFKYVPTPTIIKDIKSFFAKLLSSRDAYWKERVGIAYEQGRYDEAQAFDKVMQTPITNEDNLK